MGQVIHHAIVVTTYSRANIDQAHTVAGQIFPTLTPPVESPVNGFWSFLIPPDGSNVGWEDDVAGDLRREQFHRWIADQEDEDGGNPYQVIEIAYYEVVQPVITWVNGHRVAVEDADY